MLKVETDCDSALYEVDPATAASASPPAAETPIEPIVEKVDPFAGPLHHNASSGSAGSLAASPAFGLRRQPELCQQAASCDDLTAQNGVAIIANARGMVST